MPIAASMPRSWRVERSRHGDELAPEQPASLSPERHKKRESQCPPLVGSIRFADYSAGVSAFRLPMASLASGPVIRFIRGGRRTARRRGRISASLASSLSVPQPAPRRCPTGTVRTGWSGKPEVLRAASVSSRGGSRRGGRPRGARSTRSARAGGASGLSGRSARVGGLPSCHSARCARRGRNPSGAVPRAGIRGEVRGPVGTGPGARRDPAGHGPAGRDQAGPASPVLAVSRSWRSPAFCRSRSCRSLRSWRSPRSCADRHGPAGRTRPAVAVAARLEGLRLGGGIAIVAIGLTLLERLPRRPRPRTNAADNRIARAALPERPR